MKTLKMEMIAVIALAGLALACKKNETAPADNYKSADSTQTIIDSVGPNSDSTSVGAGTTGATGEGSTGSGSAGTTQKGTVNIRQDSAAAKEK
jgi:hypothetical protein